MILFKTNKQLKKENDVVIKKLKGCKERNYELLSRIRTLKKELEKFTNT